MEFPWFAIFDGFIRELFRFCKGIARFKGVSQDLEDDVKRPLYMKHEM